MVRMPHKHLALTSMLLAILLAAGCASRPVADSQTGFIADPAVAALDRWQVNGRLALSNGRDGGSGDLEWVHSPYSDELRFHSALGQGSWRLLIGTEGATLVQADGTSLQADSIEALIDQHLEWNIPVSLLLDWIRGIPDETVVQAIDLDLEGRIREMVQQDWSIAYGGYYQIDGLELPRKITVNRDGNRVRLLIRQWTIDR